MSENSEKLLSSLGLCQRAGKTVVGVPMVCEAMRKGARSCVLLVLEAGDTSDNTHKRLTDKCTYYGVKHIRLNCTGEELAHSLGKSAFCGAVAITDIGMCRMIEKKL